MTRPMIDLPLHRTWLTSQFQGLLDFGRQFPAPGGGAGWLDDTGHRNPEQPVFTWITARMLHTYGLAALLGIPGARPLAEAALSGLTGTLRDDEHGGWLMARHPDGSCDTTKSAYAHAFVVLGASTAVAAGLPGARTLLDEALAVLNDRFFETEHEMYADAYNADWSECDPYRGINANMHAVEALLAAADVIDDDALRGRALGIAQRVADWASAHDWRIPEHFDAQWTPQLSLNLDTPDDQFKPFGATVGHGLEWSRLFIHLDAALSVGSPTGLIPAATNLYERAVADGWESNAAAPGFVYTTDWSGSPVVRTRLHWVAAEAVGAAAALLRATGHERYATDYATWWDHIDTVFIDHEHGSWFHELDTDNRPAAGVWAGKPDIYHAAQATLIPRLPLAPSMACAVRDGLLDQVPLP